MVHLAAVGPALHHMLPIWMSERLKTEESQVDFKEQVGKAAIAEVILKGNRPALAQYEAVIATNLAEFALKCDHFVINQCAKLAKMKEILTNQLQIAVKAAKNSINDWSSPSSSPLSGLIDAFCTSQQSNPLCLFKFEERSVKVPMNKVVGVQWQSKIAANGSISTEYPLEDCKICPLWFVDCEDYLESTEATGSAERTARETEFYKAHWECRQAMQQTLQEASVQIDETQAEWIQRNVSICQQKIGSYTLPDHYCRSLSAQLANLYDLKSELFCAQMQRKALKSPIFSVHSVPFPVKRKRGRPCKLTPVELPKKPRLCESSDSSSSAD
jgi:hypothetical protein